MIAAITAVTTTVVDVVIIAVAAMIVATTAVTTTVVDVVTTVAVAVVVAVDVVAAMIAVVVHAVVVHVVVVVAETVDHVAAAAAATKTRLMPRRLMPKLTIRRQIRLKRLLTPLAKRKRKTIRNQPKQRSRRKQEDAIVQSNNEPHARANVPRLNVQKNAQRETTVQPNQTLHQSTIPNQQLKLNPNQKQK